MFRALRQRLSRRFGSWQRRRATRLIHGPAQVQLADDQVMVVALVRDAEWFLELFFEHHFALGAAHVLVIDNGSRDGTLQICRQRERVTVLQNLLPAKLHESALRAELGQKVAQGGWLLFADSDELIETPAPLARLTQWCNAKGYTAVLGQMLERFAPAVPIVGQSYPNYRAAVAAMTGYSLNQVETLDYDDREAVEFHWLLRNNQIEAPQGRFKRGGIRHEIFGETPFLTKHSLVRNLPAITPMSHPHCASGVVVADVALLLHHYKFADDWAARDARSVASAYWAHGEDARRLARLHQGGAGAVAAHPRPWRGLAQLQHEGFLYASPAFLAAEAQALAPEAAPPSAEAMGQASA